MTESNFGYPVAGGVQYANQGSIFSTPVAPGSLYSEYVAGGWGSVPQQNSGPAHSVRYSDPHDSTVPPFVRSQDLLTLDTDPFGEKTVKYGQSIGQAWDSNYTAGLSVFGKPMSREKLSSTDAGRELLIINEQNRAGVRRDFFEALVHDFHLSDMIPFFGTVASISGSVSDANQVSETFKKLQNNEPVSDDDLIKARLYLAKQERDANGTWGASVGDILRTTPGFMMEFGLTGKFLGGARNLAARTLAESGSSWAPFIGMNKAQSFIARKTTENAIRSVGEAFVKDYSAKLAPGAASTVLTTAEGVAKAMENPVIRNRVYETVKGGIVSTIKADPLASRLYAGLPDKVISRMAGQRALYEMADATARLSESSAVRRSLASAWRATKDRLSSAFLDFGDWGTSAASVVGMKNDTVSRHVADAMWNLFLEAPVRGAIIQAPGHFLARPLIGAVTGNGLSPVDPTELSIQSSAYAQGNRELMDSAGAKALGSRVFMYAAGEAGKSFGSIMRAIGIGSGLSQLVETSTAGGLTAPSARLVREAAKGNVPGRISGVQFTGLFPNSDGYKVGGMLRSLIDKYVTKPGTVRSNIVAERTDAVMRKLEGLKLGRDVVETAVRTGSVDALPQAARDAIGPDFAKFTEQALSEMYEATKENHRFRSLFWLGIADKMQSMNIGPDAVNAVFEKMGYHGTLGTMLGMRYSEVAKGLFGFDDRDSDSFKERLSNALEGMWPGWKQLTAEAVGFSFPGLVRAGAHRAINALGGGNMVTRARVMHENFSRFDRYPVMVKASADQYRDACASARTSMEARKTALQERLDAIPKDTSSAEGLVERTAIEAQVKTLDESIKSLKTSWDKFEQSLRDGSASGSDDIWVSIDRRESVAAGADTSSDQSVADAAASYEAFRNMAAEYARVRFVLHNMQKSPSGLTGFARRAVGISAALLTGEMDLARANPMQWREMDYGLPPGLGDLLEKGYRRVYSSVAERLRNEAVAKGEEAVRINRSRNASDGYDKSSPELTSRTGFAENVFGSMEGADPLMSHTYEVKPDDIHRAAVAEFAAEARDIVDRVMAMRGMMVFSNAEIRNIALDDAAAADGLFRRSHADSFFTSSDGRKVSADDVYASHRVEVDADMAKMMKTTFDILLTSKAGALTKVDKDGNRVIDSEVQVRSDNVDQNLHTFGVFNAVPVNYGRTDLAILGKVMRQRSLGRLFTTHELVDGVPVSSQISCDEIPARVMSALSRLAAMPIDTAVDTSLTRATEYEGAALETLARRLRVPYDGTSSGLAERNRRLLEIIRASGLGVDPNARRYVRDRLVSDDDTRHISNGLEEAIVRRLADGRWKTYEKVVDESGRPTGEVRPLTFDTEEALDRYMASKDYTRAEFEFAITPTKAVVTDDYLTALRSVDLLHEYELETENAISAIDADRTYRIGDPLFMVDSNGRRLFATDELAAAERRRILEEADEYARIVGDPSDTAAARWETFAPRGADLTDPEVVNKAKARMDDLYHSWERAYDPDTGMVSIADRVLSRRGFHVDGESGRETGVGLRNLTASFRRRYSLPIRAFADMTKTGRIFVPVDYTNYQDLPAAFMAAGSFRAFFGNRERILWNCWHASGDGKSVVPGPLVRVLAAIDKSLVSAVTRNSDPKNARTGSTDFVRRIEAFRDVLGCRDILSYPNRRWVTPQAFEYISTYLAGFQLERDIDSGSSTCKYSDVLREIATEVRGTPEFRTFFGELDRIFGGSGFTDDTTLRKAKRMRGAPENENAAPEPPTGLRRWYELSPGRGGKEYEKSVRQAFFGVESAEDLLSVVSDLQQALRSRGVDVPALDAAPSGDADRRPSSAPRGAVELLGMLDSVFDMVNEARRLAGVGTYAPRDKVGYVRSFVRSCLEIGRDMLRNDPQGYLVEAVRRAILDYGPGGDTAAHGEGKGASGAENRINVTPTLEPRETPDPKVNKTPDTEVNKTPDTEVNKTPDTEVNKTPDTEVNKTPTDGVEQTDEWGDIVIDEKSLSVEDFAGRNIVPSDSADRLFEPDGVVMSAGGGVQSPDPSSAPARKVTVEDTSGVISTRTAEDFSHFAASCIDVVFEDLSMRDTQEKFVDRMDSFMKRLIPGRSAADYAVLHAANVKRAASYFKDGLRTADEKSLRSALRAALYGVPEDKADTEGAESSSNVFSKYADAEAKSILNRRWAELSALIAPHDSDSVAGSFTDLRAKVAELARQYPAGANHIDEHGNGVGVKRNEDIDEAIGLLGRILNPRGDLDAKSAAHARSRYDAVIAEVTGIDSAGDFSTGAARTAQLNTSRDVSRRLARIVGTLLYGGPRNRPISRHGAAYLMFLATLEPQERAKFLSTKYGIVALQPQTINTSVSDALRTDETTLRPAYTLMNDSVVNARNPSVSAYTSSLANLVGMHRKDISDIVNFIRRELLQWDRESAADYRRPVRVSKKGVTAPSPFTVSTATSVIRRNGRKLADILIRSSAIDYDSPIFSILTSAKMIQDLRRESLTSLGGRSGTLRSGEFKGRERTVDADGNRLDPKTVDETLTELVIGDQVSDSDISLGVSSRLSRLAESLTAYGMDSGTIPLVSRFLKVLESARFDGENGTITPEESSRLGMALFTTGLTPAGDVVDMKNPALRADRTTEWNELMSAYSGSLPRSIVHARLSTRGGTRVKDGSVTAVIPGLNPMAMDFTFGKFTELNRNYIASLGITDQAEVDRRLSESRQNYTWGNDYSDPVFSKLVAKGYKMNEINEACELSFYLEKLSAFDILGSGKSEIEGAPGRRKYTKKDIAHMKECAARLRLLCSGVDATDIRDYGKSGAADAPDVIDYASEMIDRGNRAADLALRNFRPRRMVSFPVCPGDHSSYVMMQVPVDYLVGNHMSYAEFSRHMLSQLGLSRMGGETKRTAVCTSEADPVPLFGTRYSTGSDGTTKETVGQNWNIITWHAAPSAHGAKDNEDNIGSTYMDGYGAEACRMSSPDPRRETGKYHIMSGKSLIKSLILFGRPGSGDFGMEGAPLVGSTSEGFHALNRKFLKSLPDDVRKLSTATCTDFDSEKFDHVLNSPVDSVSGNSDGSDAAPLMKYVFAKVRAALGDRASADADGEYSGKDANGNDIENYGMIELPGEGGSRYVDGLSAEELDTLVGPVYVVSSGKPAAKPVMLSSLIGKDARLVRAEGLSSPAFGLAVRNDEQMAYGVANVSHRALPSLGRSPRNHSFGDMLTMASIQARGFTAGAVTSTGEDGRPVVSDPVLGKSAKEISAGLMEFAARHGVIASVVGLNPDTARYMAEFSPDGMEHTAGGEAIDGQNHSDAAATQVSSMIRKSLQVSMFGSDMPLVSSGSTVAWDAQQNKFVTRHTAKSVMIRDTLQGALVIPTHLQDFYGGAAGKAYHVDALCNANVDITDYKSGGCAARYGWYLDMDRFMEATKSNDILREAWDRHASVTDQEQRVVLTFEDLFVRMRNLQVAAMNSAAADPKGGDIRKIRELLGSVFMDHHRDPIGLKQVLRRQRNSVTGAERSLYLEYTDTVGFDDLFTLVGDGTTPVFDRTAFRFGMRIDAGKDRYGKAYDKPTSHIYLAGTKMGFPRTPSYNGTMWNQNVRLGLPVTERRVRTGANGHTAAGPDDYFYAAGTTAMVSPDPYTLKILGCDHDGDKTKMFMLRHNQYGIAPCVAASSSDLDKKMPVADLTRDKESLDRLLSDTESSADSPRRLLRDRLRSLGYLSFEGADPTKGIRGYEVLSEKYRYETSNFVVRRLFDMNRMIPVPTPGSEWIPFYNPTPDADRGPASRGTKASVIAEDRMKGLLRKFAGSPETSRFSRRNAFSGSARIESTDVASQVTTVASQADESRGKSVSLSLTLHIAMATGLFDSASKTRNLFGDLDVHGWADYMYHQDGVPNATFDDIKEQVCDRLGWTPGMMDTFIVHCMASGTRAPRTDAEFESLVTDYVKSASDGPYAPMILACDNSTDHVSRAQEFRQFLGKVFMGRYGEYVSPAKIHELFGINQDHVDPARPDTLVDAFVEASGGLKVAGNAGTPAQVLSRAIREAIKLEGLTDSQQSAVIDRLLNRSALSGGFSSDPGYLYYLLGKASGRVEDFMEPVTHSKSRGGLYKSAKTSSDIRAEMLVSRLVGTEVTPTAEQAADLIAEARKYVKMSVLSDILSTAGKLTRSINYFRSDPLDPSGYETLTRIKGDFADFMDDVGKHPPSRELDGTLNTRHMTMMNAALQLSYQHPAGFSTLRGRAHRDLSVMDTEILPRIHSMATAGNGPRSRAIAAFGAQILSAPKLSSSDYSFADRQAVVAQLEHNYKTNPYIASALVNMPAAYGKSPFNTLDPLDVMRTAADALSNASRGISPGDAEFSPTDTPTAAFLRAVNSMFMVQKFLAATSTEHDNHPAFTSFAIRRKGSTSADVTDRIGFSDSRYTSGEFGDDYGLFGIMVPFFGHNDDTGLQDRVRADVGYWASGALDRPRARVPAGRRLAKGSYADSFSLNVKNLRRLVAELGANADEYAAVVARDRVVGDRDTAWRAPLLSAIADCEAILTAFRDSVGSDVEITPSSLIRQWLPLYSTIVSDTTGAGNDASSRSLFSVLPIEMFKRISDGAQRLTSDPVTGEMLRAYNCVDMRPVSANAPKSFEVSEDASPEYLSDPAALSAAGAEFAGISTTPGTPDGGPLFAGGIAAFRRGTGDKSRVYRRNPSGMFLNELFSNGCPMRQITAVAARPKREPLPLRRFSDSAMNDAVSRDTDVGGKLTSGDPDVTVARLADVCRGYVSASPGSSVDVVGNTIMIRGRFSGSGAVRFLKNAKRAKVLKDQFGTETLGSVIQVRVAPAGTKLGGETVAALAGSRAYAESLFNAVSGDGTTVGAKLGLRSPGEFLLMSPKVREAFVRRYGFSGFSAYKPTFTTDGRGLAMMVGKVSVTEDASTGTLFHEIFHSNVSMIREMGLLSDADVGALREAFPSAGKTDWFNEERAAEAYKAFIRDHVSDASVLAAPVAAGAAYDSDAVKRAFSGILRAAEGIYESLKSSYDADGTPDRLFKVVLTGYVPESRDAAKRKRLMTKAELAAMADTLRTASSVEEALSAKTDIMLRDASLDANPEELSESAGLVDAETLSRADSSERALLSELLQDVPDYAEVSRHLADHVSARRAILGKTVGAGAVEDVAGPASAPAAPDVPRDSSMEAAKARLRNARMGAAPSAGTPSVLDALRGGVSLETPGQFSVPPEMAPGHERIELAAAAAQSADPDAWADRRTYVGDSAPMSRAAALHDAIADGFKADLGTKYWQILSADCPEAVSMRGMGRMYRIAERTLLSMQNIGGHDYGVPDDATKRRIVFANMLNVMNAASGRAPNAKELPRSKYKPTGAQLAGAIMASTRVTPAGHLQAAAARVADIARQSRDRSVMAFADFITDKLSGLRAAASAGELYDGSRREDGTYSDTFGEFFRDVMEPLAENEGIAPDGGWAPFELKAEPSESPVDGLYRAVLAKDGLDPVNREAHEAAQDILHVALDTAYGLSAGKRLFRELGVGTDQVAGAEAFDTIFSDIPVRPKTILEMAADNGIGPAHLVEEDPYMSFYAHPAFAAHDTRTWLDSSIMSNFGDSAIRESMRAIHNDLDGVSHAISAESSYVYRMLGLDCNPGDKLYSVETREGEWSFDGEGGVRHGKTGENHQYFDVYGNKTTDVRTTLESVRANDMYLKAASVLVGGGRLLVTGANMFHASLSTYDAVRRNFTRFGITPEEYFSSQRVEARIADAKGGKNADPLDMALSRLKEEIPEEYLGYTTNTGLYRKITDTLVRLFRESVAERRADRVKALEYGRADGGSWTDETFNEYVLRGLEREGLLVTNKGSRGHWTGSAAFDAASYVDWWKNVSPHRKTLVDAGRDPAALEPDELLRPLVRSCVELKRLVEKYPFLSSGDGAFFHNVKTLMPGFQGTGMFMWGANRKLRSASRTREPGMTSEFERTYLDLITRPNADTSDISDQQLELLRKSFRLNNHNMTALRSDIAAGMYEAGTPEAVKTGLVLPKSATMADVARAIYERNCQLGWLSTLAGSDYEWARDLVRELGGPEAIGSMTDAYENTLEQGTLLGGVSRYGYGLTDEQMFRMHGALPKNYELPKKLQVMADGIRNAVFFRNSLASMLMTPDLDGMPTCYANPAMHADLKSGLDDAFWGMLARWWGKCHASLAGKYDTRLSGVENASRMYRELVSSGEVRDGELVHGGEPRSTSAYTDVRLGGKRFRRLGRDLIDSGITALDDVIAQNGDEEETGVGNHAFDYMRHLLQSSRCFGTTATRAAIHRALSWSKSGSVAFSFFFPLATRWESPTGAFGAVATLGSNLAPGFLRDHADAASVLQKMFGGNGWITSDFFGAKDALSLMDSNDPFYAEVLSWASALGITLQDHNVNPLDPTRAIVDSDLRKLTTMVTDSMGAKAGRAFKKVTDELLVKSGDRAFAYALNSVKVAAVVQMAQKLRHMAMVSGKAFDPIRDLRKYADYLNAEIGGIDPLKYSWAHPEMRSLMERMFFSWQWTRGAWEAGGGGAIEDMLFGTHNTNPEMRKYLLGRWARMYGTVMIGVPVMMQLAAKALGLAMGHDDDDDKWFTWENEDKTRWSAADITPLLRGMENLDNVIGDATGVGADNANKLWAALGGGLGYAMGGVPGAVGGAVMGLLAPRYTGRDASNMATGKRRFYMHFGKQGWEFARWFDKPVQQFFSKLSMPTQRILEGVMGRSLSWMDHELPWNDMGDVERWLNPTVDGASFNLLKAFLPFTVNGAMQYGDAGFLSAFGPVQMGVSKTAVIDRLKTRLEQWAKNDRRAYAAGARSNFPKVPNRMALVGDILSDARKNGYSPKQCEQLVAKALGQVTNRLYGDLFAALPETPDGKFDKERIERVARAINRLQRKYKAVMTSMKSRLDARGHEWKTLDSRIKDLYRTNVRNALDNPFSFEGTVPPARDEY